LKTSFTVALLSLSLLSFLGTSEAAATSSKSKAATQTRKVKSVVVRKSVAAPVIRAVPTFGQVAGLHDVEDPLDLKSSVAYVLDQNTNEVLFSKNPQAVLPIASITKLMTALVVVESGLSLDEKLTVTDEDIDTEKFTRSRLAVGTTLTRGEMLHLALMASENRAAHALGRHYPGGLSAFVAAMNAKAVSLGMSDTHYVEPTGLSSRNQSSAKDLAALVNVTSQVPLLRDLSTSREARVALGKRLVQFRSTNGLLSNPLWDIGLQKTGFINEAGKCVVMQARMAGRQLIMVFLDSSGKTSRIADAERMRKWLAAQPGEATTTSAKL
jgi:D-alanyl-D-alanine endopeptidase (penicillin-binding protein 7)